MKYKCAVEKAKNLIVWRKEGEKKTMDGNTANATQ